MTGTVRQDWQDYWVSTIPFGRMGTPDEMCIRDRLREEGYEDVHAGDSCGFGSPLKICLLYTSRCV